MEQLRQQDFRAVLDCVAGIYAHDDLNSFGQRVLELVPKVVTAAFSGYNEFNARRERGTYILDAPDVSFGPSAAAWDVLIRHHPLIRHYQSTGDGTARKISDFMPRRRYHESALYRELFCQAGVEYMIALYLPEAPPNSVALALARDCHDFTERDRLLLNLIRPHLSQAYRHAEVVTRLREQAALMMLALEALPRGVVILTAQGRIRFCSAPARQWLTAWFGRNSHAQGRLPDAVERWLSQQQLPTARSRTLPAPRQPLVIQRNGSQLTIRLLADPTPGQQTLVMEERRTELSATPLQRLGLTGREAEVLLWVAQGKTNPEIGTILRLSTGTIHKHTEHIFTKLGVETRTAAAARAWEATTGDSAGGC